jgi:hypothetical protein
LGQPVAFSEGLCGVFKDGKWGYIDTGGHIAIPTQFDSAGPFVEELARVNLGNQVGFIDKTGQYAINPQFYEGGDFHDGLAAVRSDGGWGFINKTGVYVVKPQFQFANANGFSDGFAPVCQGKCGYINRNGTFVIRQQFDAVKPFSEGMAAVRMNNKWGYINTSGKIVINPQFDYTTMFSGGLAVTLVSGHSGTINKHGKYVVNPGQYEMAPVGESDLLRVTNSDGVGLLTRDGKWVVKPSKVVSVISMILGKVFYATIGGESVPVSMSGKVLAGWYKGAILDSLAQDIENENSALQSVRVLTGAESSYSGAYPAKGFTNSIEKLGPATGTPDENHAGIIDAALATGTKDNYQFAITIPAGTSTGGTNFNYFIVAKPAAGHAGRGFCADSSATVHYAVQGEDCKITSPAL